MAPVSASIDGSVPGARTDFDVGEPGEPQSAVIADEPHELGAHGLWACEGRARTDSRTGAALARGSLRLPASTPAARRRARPPCQSPGPPSQRLARRWAVAARPETITSRPFRSTVATSCAVWTRMSSIFCARTNVRDAVVRCDVRFLDVQPVAPPLGDTEIRARAPERSRAQSSSGRPTMGR